MQPRILAPAPLLAAFTADRAQSQLSRHGGNHTCARSEQQSLPLHPPTAVHVRASAAQLHTQHKAAAARQRQRQAIDEAVYVSSSEAIQKTTKPQRAFYKAFFGFVVPFGDARRQLFGCDENGGHLSVHGNIDALGDLFESLFFSLPVIASKIIDQKNHTVTHRHLPLKMTQRQTASSTGHALEARVKLCGAMRRCPSRCASLRQLFRSRHRSRHVQR